MLWGVWTGRVGGGGWGSVALHLTLNLLTIGSPPAGYTPVVLVGSSSSSSYSSSSSSSSFGCRAIADSSPATVGR